MFLIRVFFVVGFLLNMCVGQFSFASSLEMESPEKQIVIWENFITPEESQALMQLYKNEQRDLLVESDNQLSFSDISDVQIKKMLFEISKRVLRVLKQSYELKGMRYHLDHGGIYSRIRGNFCPYHADNIAFDCPIHGNDQGVLRQICPGTCLGAKFVPNHTYWREYTALIYLNDDFEGGEILFEDGPCNQRYRTIIPIKKNMMILAPNGQDFYHEVFPIRQGTRYSVHMWYTSDPNHRTVLVR